jgi:hypothetical protein
MRNPPTSGALGQCRPQGKHAAWAMLGTRAPFVHVPYFFSDVFDLS